MTPEEGFESVVRALRGRGITLSRMFGSPGLRVGDKVFAMLYKGRLVVKLPEDRVAALVRSGKGELFDPGHGRKMKEWVAVRHGDVAWLALAREARDFVTAQTPRGRSPRRRRSRDAR